MQNHGIMLPDAPVIIIIMYGLILCKHEDNGGCEINPENPKEQVQNNSLL